MLFNVELDACLVYTSAVNVVIFLLLFCFVLFRSMGMAIDFNFTKRQVK